MKTYLNKVNKKSPSFAVLKQLITLAQKFFMKKLLFGYLSSRAKLCLLFTFILVIPPLKAQDLTGKVVEQNSKYVYGKVKAIEGAVVKMTDNMTKTNPNGFFQLSFRDVPLAFVNVEKSGYVWINEQEVERQLACKIEQQPLIFELADAKILFNNYARFHQELKKIYQKASLGLWNQIRNESDEEDIKPQSHSKYGKEKSASAALETLLEETEPMLEYWAKKLAKVNLDKESPSMINDYQQLKNGTLGKIFFSTSKKQIPTQAEIDLQLALLVASLRLKEATELTEQIWKRSNKDLERALELRTLYRLQKDYNKLQQFDIEVLKIPCSEAQRFQLLGELGRSYMLELNYELAKKYLNPALVLGKKLMQLNELRFAKDYANVLLDIATLEKSNEEKSTSEQLYLEAINWFEDLSFELPLQYEPELLKAQLLMASFYFLEANRNVKAFQTLNEAIAICQRLSRRYPQLFLDELALAYTLQGAFYFRSEQIDLSTSAYLLAIRYYDLLAKTDFTFLDKSIETRFLVGQINYQQLINTNDINYKTKVEQVIGELEIKIANLENIKSDKGAKFRAELKLLAAAVKNWRN